MLKTNIPVGAEEMFTLAPDVFNVAKQQKQLQLTKNEMFIKILFFF